MSFETLKELVQRIATDVSYARSFVAEPDRILSSYNLGLAERRSMMRLHVRLATADGAGEIAGPMTWWP
jgi:hypothetical protein